MNLQSRLYSIIYRLFPVIICLTLLPEYSNSVRSQQPRQNRPQSNDQKPPADEPLIRLETELVQIDMVVTDKNGNLVEGLRREDFELYEDGKKQAITHFAVGTATRPATWLRTRPNSRTSSTESAIESVTETVAGRYIVLAVDDYHIAPENLLLTKRALKNFVTDQLIAGDQVALITTSGILGMYQQFTSQRTILERAIDRLSIQNRTSGSNLDIPRLSDYQAELIDRGDPDALELAIQEILRIEAPITGGQPPGAQAGGRGASSSLDTQSPRSRAAERARSKARMVLSMNANYTRITLETLNNVIRSLKPLAGRKMLVLLSDGFHLGGNHASQTFDIRRITDAATRAGVVIYSLDSRGLVAPTPGGDISQPSYNDGALSGVRARIEMGSIDAVRNGMNALAYDTGGFLIYNTNDLNLGLQKVLDDNQIYYVLAYEPPESRRDGRFHKIEVKIADRQDLKVRTRKGYFAPTRKAEKKPEPVITVEVNDGEKLSPEVEKKVQAAKETELRTSIASLFPLREIPIDVSVEFLDATDEGNNAMVSAFIEARNLNLQQIGELQSGKLDLRVFVFDEGGQAIINYNDLISLNLPQKTAETVRKYGLSYRKFISLKPGHYQARVAVREESTGKIGSASNWVEISDLSKNKLALSSILLSEADSEMPKSDASNPPQFTLNPTTAKRRFNRNNNIDFLIFAYNARLKDSLPDVVIQAQVYSGSKLVYASHLAKISVTAESDLKRLPYAARVSLEDFNEGEYELRIVAIDRLTRQTANRRINFTVEVE